MPVSAIHMLVCAPLLINLILYIELIGLLVLGANKGPLIRLLIPPSPIIGSRLWCLL